MIPYILLRFKKKKLLKNEVVGEIIKTWNDPLFTLREKSLLIWNANEFIKSTIYWIGRTWVQIPQPHNLQTL